MLFLSLIAALDDSARDDADWSVILPPCRT
jgi:hypothetical protein